MGNESDASPKELSEAFTRLVRIPMISGASLAYVGHDNAQKGGGPRSRLFVSSKPLVPGIAIR